MSDRDDLNRVLAERLFGYEGLDEFCACNKGRAEHTHYAHYDVPDYAGTWEGCGLVLEAMRARGYEILISTWPDDRPWQVQIGVEAADARELPEAAARVSVAALEAEASTLA